MYNKYGVLQEPHQEKASILAEQAWDIIKDRLKMYPLSQQPIMIAEIIRNLNAIANEEIMLQAHALLKEEQRNEESTMPLWKKAQILWNNIPIDSSK